MAIGNKILNVDIDDYLNRFVPRSRVHRLPKPIAAFLGHRDRPPAPVAPLLTWLWGFLGAFCGISLIEGVTRVSPWIQSINPPVIVASFGAAAILEYNTIESPLAQPRNLIFGQILSATVGVCITKLFNLLPPDRYEDLNWLAGALCVATASFVMGFTKTVHPPAGATSLLAATNPQVMAMGWNYIPLVIVGDLLMLGSACVLNNLQRRFPLYWWTPKSLEKPRGDVPPLPTKAPANGAQGGATTNSTDLEKAPRESPQPLRQINVTAESIDVPEWLVLDQMQTDMLRVIQAKLAAGPESSPNQSSSTP